ncbi:MAG: tetratricopeptide repeat protein [Firmicutes bacterium]|nr:tetratricopeptide repeat protein [Bacillota bacterium]
MQCPNCKTIYEFGSNCPHCRIDTVLYRRSVHLSNRFYNQGLEKIKKSNLTQGIELLVKSLAINKNNIDARNLLGLAHFEVGHIGEALKHWVISNSLLTKDNPAEGYLERINKHPRALEKMNDAVTMYNYALGHIKQKSDDLAIIQLKKALENNPRFVDALNLLALCHLIQNDKERALTMVERVLLIDVENPIAQNYYSILSPKGKVPKYATSPTKFITKPIESLAPPAPYSVGPYKAMSIKEKKSTNFHIAEILTFIIGVVSTLAIIYFLLYPAFQSEHEREIARLEQDAVQAAAVHQAEVEAILADKDELQTVVYSKYETIRGLEDILELQGRINIVHQADWLYQDNQLQEAIDVLDELDTTGMAFDIRDRIDAIRRSAYPRLASAYFNEGQRAFTASDYSLALINLELAYRFMEEGVTTQWRDLWFMLGQIYYEEERLEEAHEMLTNVREHFPQHRPQGTARMLTSIENRW